MAINHVHIDETQSQKVTSSTVQSKGGYYILIHKLGGLEEGGYSPTIPLQVYTAQLKLVDGFPLLSYMAMGFRLAALNELCY